MNSYDKKDFVFERDTGIEFQHARPNEQPFKITKNQFTVIPRLESVKAEEYNKKFEEMRKAMPKNLAYAGKFGRESVIPPGVSTRKNQPEVSEKPEIKNKPEIKETPVSQNTVPAPAVKETAPPPPSKNIVKTPALFYTGYGSEKGPFNDDTYKSQEFVIENDNKQKNASFRDKIKQTFHKLFSSSAEEENYNYDDE